MNEIEYLTDKPSPFGYPQPAVKLYSNGQLIKKKNIDVEATVVVAGNSVADTYQGYVEDFLSRHTEYDSADIIQYELVNGQEQEHFIRHVSRK